MAETVVNQFKAAVEATPDICNCYQPGLRALGANSSKITMTNNSQCKGSVNIDDCVKAKYRDSNRWDYCLGYGNQAYFIEVHPASTSDVSTMLKKLSWLKDWLKNNARELDNIKAKTPYHWIMSGKYDIVPDSAEARRLALAGLKPISRLNLK